MDDASSIREEWITSQKLAKQKIELKVAIYKVVQHPKKMYQQDMMQDIYHKASYVLQENERPIRISIIMDILRHIPQIILNTYQNYHEKA